MNMLNTVEGPSNGYRRQKTYMLIAVKGHGMNIVVKGRRNEYRR